MKKLKKGFSLAEILISVGIISVIAVLGFNITKQSIEKAYDLYVFTGYEGMTLALNDADNNGKKIGEPDPLEDTAIDEVTAHLCTLLSCKNREKSKSDEDLAKEDIFSFETPNKIAYRFQLLQSNNNNNDTTHLYLITMTVPARNNQTRSYEFFYDPKNGATKGIIVPRLDSTTLDNGNLINRKDLLPAYLDDGTQGTYDDNGTYNPIVYLTIREALCRTANDSSFIIVGQTQFNNGLLDENSIYDTINCGNDKDDKSGVIRVVSPRKVF